MTTASVILKFGGASLGNPDRIAERIQEGRRRGRPLVVVASAREGVTQSLRDFLASPDERSPDADSLVEALAARHPNPDARGRAELHRLRRLANAARHRPGDAARADAVLAEGERLAVRWLAVRLGERGLPMVALDADRLGLATDAAYGAATLDWEGCQSRVRRRLRSVLRAGRIPLVTGFIGRSADGRVTTLGRGGSDYSATALGAILGASRVELVKREVSVLTADPRAVRAARPIPRLTYEEAEELAQFGAQVLHPLAVEPARASGVEIWVRSLEEPERMTVIGPPTAERSGPMRALTLLSPLRLLRVRVPGGRQRPGVVAEVSSTLARAGVNLVTLFTSSALLSLVLEPAAVRAGQRALAHLALDGAATVEGPVPVALVTAIGEGVLADVERWPSPLLRRAEGFSATPRSLSLAVPETKGRSALVALHRLLVEGRAG